MTAGIGSILCSRCHTWWFCCHYKWGSSNPTVHKNSPFLEFVLVYTPWRDLKWGVDQGVIMSPWIIYYQLPCVSLQIPVGKPVYHKCGTLSSLASRSRRDTAPDILTRMIWQDKLADLPITVVLFSNVVHPTVESSHEHSPSSKCSSVGTGRYDLMRAHSLKRKTAAIWEQWLEVVIAFRYDFHIRLRRPLRVESLSHLSVDQ